MAKNTVIQTKGGPLTEDDFEGEAPSPGTNDARYSGSGKKAIQSVAERVRAAAGKAGRDEED